MTVISVFKKEIIKLGRDLGCHCQINPSKSFTHSASLPTQSTQNSGVSHKFLLFL